MSKQFDGAKRMQTYSSQFTGVRYTAVRSVLLTLLLLMGLFASLSFAAPAMVIPTPTHRLSSPFSTGELTPTYVITGQVRSFDDFPLDGLVIYAGSQYSTTLD